MTPIRLGFVGLSSSGWASSTLAAPLFQPPLSSKYHVVAVSTSNSDSATESAKKYSKLGSKATGQDIEVKAYYGSTEHISADSDVDMVAVSIKTMMHKEAALKVIEAGKDLFLEWPVGKDAKETEELYEAAKKKGIKSLIGTQIRASSFVREVKSIVDSGKIGRVLSTTLIVSYTHDVLGTWGKYIIPAQTYLLDASNGAGLLDIGAGHPLDMFQYVLGPIASLSSTTYNPYPEAIVVSYPDRNPTGEKVLQDIPTLAAASGLLHNNAVFSLLFQSGVAKDAVGFLWLLDGEEGNIRIEDTKNVFFQTDPDVFLNGHKVDFEKEEDDYARVRRPWESFADGRVDEYPSLEDALRTRRVVDAIKESAITGENVVVHPV